MMRINAYILAADPTWIEYSINSYYGIVSRIVISYDENSRGWTGTPVEVENSLSRLRAIDHQQKMQFSAGSYSVGNLSPMDGETKQRQAAFDAASVDADWVLQLDADEVIPHPDSLVKMLEEAQTAGFVAVEWPMRVLFRRISKGRFLEVCSRNGDDHFEYPGPIAVRPGVQFKHARGTDGPYLRLVVRGDTYSHQITHAVHALETRWECLEPDDAIIHNSWGRDARSIRSKIASWGHHEGWKTWMFYYLRWLPAPWTWRRLRNFHPLYRALWPALKPCEVVAKHPELTTLDH